MDNGENDLNKGQHLISVEEEYPSQEEINNNTNIQVNEDYNPPPTVYQSNQINPPNMNPQNIPDVNKPTDIPISVLNDEYPYPEPPPNNYINSQPEEIISKPNVVQVEPVTQVTPITQTIQVQPVVEVPPVIQVQPVTQVQPIIYTQPIITRHVNPAPRIQRHQYKDDEDCCECSQSDCENCGEILKCLCIFIYCFVLLAGSK